MKSVTLLKLENCTVYYQKALAIENINLKVEENELVSIIGSNGAGKTTILKSISGIVKLTKGTVTFDGEVLNGLPPYKIVGKGISLCPEAGRLAPEMTVLENLELGAYLEKNKREIQRRFGERMHLHP